MSVFFQILASAFVIILGLADSDVLNVTHASSRLPALSESV
jgi:hypothetical protein